VALKYTPPAASNWIGLLVPADVFTMPVPVPLKYSRQVGIPDPISTSMRKHRSCGSPGLGVRFVMSTGVRSRTISWFEGEIVQSDTEMVPETSASLMEPLGKIAKSSLVDCRVLGVPWRLADEERSTSPRAPAALNRSGVFFVEQAFDCGDLATAVFLNAAARFSAAFLRLGLVRLLAIRV
jgi:hypothetical protein